MNDSLNDSSLPERSGRLAFPRPLAFWLGTLAVTVGAACHLPMYLMGQDMGYQLVGMPMDAPMMLGMLAIVLGLGACLYGLLPPAVTGMKEGTHSFEIQTMDEAKLSPAHIGLLLTMSVAVTIDIMKPTALAFVMPGMTIEYNLLSPLNPGGTTPAAWVALSGITGTVLGSFLWGWLGDRIGRRGSILFAGIGFIGTSICGAMPDFWWNVAMCFLMGLTVGGMLPICYALLAETMPSRHRGFLMVLVGADIAGAYVLTSWLAAAMVPTYSWRILWLIGLPTGVLFILMNRWIPESPRFLLSQGRESEARAVMARYGAKLVMVPRPEPVLTIRQPARWFDLASPQLLGPTLLVSFIALGSGLVLFGFNLWIPTNLRKMGFTQADEILRNASMMAFPLTLLVAWLYGFWSSKKTLILLVGLTSAALFGFVFFSDQLAQNRALLYVLLVIPVWGISSVTAVLSVYSSEIYPTEIRSRGTGFVAGMCKLGGVLIIALVVLAIATPSIKTVALIGAIPMALALLLASRFGPETRRRRLEEIAQPG